MSRAAFLPSVGDPFPLLHTIKYFNNIWQDEVDSLYIIVASVVEQEVVNLLLPLLNHPKMKVTCICQELQHGAAIDEMLERCTEDNILLIEDDSIIFKKGIVDHYFNLIESGEVDMIGSPRMSCHPKIAEMVQKKYHLDYSGYGDKGPAYWPCFLWVKKEDLLHTDRDFKTHIWQPGDNICGHIVDETIFGDTFVHTSVQLRDMGLRILDIPQYHCGPDDFINRRVQRGIFDRHCGYLHFGSLSSGIGSYLLDDENIALAYRSHRPKVYSTLATPQSDTDKIEMTRRVAWWLEAYKSPFPDCTWKELYIKAINKLVTQFSISSIDINTWRDIYLEVIDAYH